MSHGGVRENAGRNQLPASEKKKGVYIKLPPRLIAAMDAAPESRAVLIEQELSRKLGLCGRCFRPMHRPHGCEFDFYICQSKGDRPWETE